MSRTYAHVPYSVRVVREGEESHDHRNGVCDLPENTLHEHRSWRRHGSHYKKCKKLRYYLVTCQHIISIHKDWINPEYREHIHPTPHQVLSVYDYTNQTYIQAHWDLPAVKSICTRNWESEHHGYSPKSYAMRPYEVKAMVRTDERFSQHEYVWVEEDAEVPCTCDEPYNYSKCDYDLPRRLRRQYFGYGCSCCDSKGWLNDLRYGTRNNIRMDLDKMKDAWNSGEEDIDELF